MLLAGHTGGVDWVEAISAALAAHNAQSDDRIEETLAFSYISGFFGQGLSYNSCYLLAES